MRRLGTLSALLAVVAVSSGCVTYDRAFFAMVSTEPVLAATTVVAEDVEGRVCNRPFDVPLERAIDAALQNVDGANALVDVQYRFQDLCLVVNATAVRLE